MSTKKVTKKIVAPLKKVGVKKLVVSKVDLVASTKVNHIIPKALGLEMITRFKESIKNLSKVKFEMGKEFDKSFFEALLKLKGIENVRIYNALNEHNGHTFVITALDKNSNEIYFKIKPSTKSKQISQGKDGSDTTTNNDGVGNMGNQCTEPPKDSRQKSAYFKL